MANPILSRRTLLQAGLLTTSGLAIAAACSKIGGESGYQQLTLERVTVRIPKLPPAFEGYRIGFLTDTHLGIWMPQERILSALDQLASEQLDLLVLGGDYILTNENPLWPLLGYVRNERYAKLSARASIPLLFNDAAQILSHFSPPDGVIGVLGNHERWNSIQLCFDAFRPFPQIRLLVNEEFNVVRGEQSLSFFGVDDYLTGLPTLPPARPLQNGVSSRILISHNPDYLTALFEREESSFNLALCGHTHGGQICVPGLGPFAVPVTDKRFVAGLVEVNNDVQVYTSRGLGMVGLPFRLNCPPEVTVFQILAA